MKIIKGIYKIKSKKKTYFICFLMLNLFAISVHSQMGNTNFSGFTFSGGNCAANTSISDCTTATAPFESCPASETFWTASHGTPEIFEPHGPTNNIALMWSGQWNVHNTDGDASTYGEGLFQECSFLKGYIYTLQYSIAISTCSNGVNCCKLSMPDVFVYLANGLTAKQNSDVCFVDGNSNVCSLYLIPAIADKQLIDNQTNFSSSSFQTFTVTFIPIKNYDAIWIYPYNSTWPISVLLVSSFAVIDECVANITYTQTSSLPASPGITSASGYVDANTNVNIGSGNTQTFTAGNHIDLGPGFSVNPGSGSYFEAFIAPCGEAGNCTNANYRMMGHDVDSSNEKKITESVKNFPNPTNGIFTLSITNPANNGFSFILTDISGRLISQKNNLISGYNSIDESNLSAGIYLWKAYTSDNNLIGTGKLVIDHSQ